MSKPILCVDFDGVIHQYDTPWLDAATISDGAVPGALEWLDKALDVFDIHIYSSRSKTLEGRQAMKDWLYREAEKQWPNDTQKVDHLWTSVTYSHEKPPAFLTIDDRAVCFEGDWDKLDVHTLRQFKPWNKREVTLK